MLPGRSVNKKMKTIVKIIAANVGMIICAGIAALLPGLWTGVSGRDFRPQATTAGILILVLSFLLTYKFRWAWLDILLSIIPTQFIILFLIGHFSGFTGFEYLDWFNIQWLLFMNLFICFPWLLGALIGLLCNKKKLINTERVNSQDSVPSP